MAAGIEISLVDENGCVSFVKYVMAKRAAFHFRSRGLKMTLDAFRQSLTADEPPAELTLALFGLWWDAKRDWKRAHESAQQDEGPEGFVGSRLPPSQRRRSGQRSVLVWSSGETCLPRTARCGVAQHRERFAEMLKLIPFVAAAIQWAERGSCGRFITCFPARSGTYGRTNL
jgi:hypothetical protein